jgi:hypothetical protein
MIDPKISIVTPSFNQAEFIEDTMRSVICQNYPNLEYIVIDGGSSDGSASIIERYSDRLSHWVSEPDGGHGAGLNKGFCMSTGEIMGWINSDDLLTPWSLRTVAEIFSKFSHVNWIQGLASSWNRQGQLTGSIRNPINIYDYLTRNYAWIQQESVFWRRSLWDKAGGAISEDMHLMVDGELWSRFFLHDELYLVDCILGGWRCHGLNRAIQYSEACHQEMDQIISTMADRCDPEILKRANMLRSILNIASFSPIRQIFGTTTAQVALGMTIGSTFAKKLFHEAGYRRISWDVGKNDWVESTLPFRSIKNWF